MDVDDALRLAEVRRNYANDYADSDAIITLADEVEQLRAENGRLRVWGEAEYHHGYSDGASEEHGRLTSPA